MINIKSIINIPNNYEISREKLVQKHENLIQDILTKEDDIINTHQKSVDEMIDIMNYEKKILLDVQEPNSDIEDYLKNLEYLMEYKENVIKDMRNKIIGIRHSLKEEQCLNINANRKQQILDVFDLDNDDFFENEQLY